MHATDEKPPGIGHRTVSTLLATARERLAGASESPGLDAELLLVRVLKSDRTSLYANPEQLVSPDAVHQYLGMVDSRREGQPVAQLVGSRAFWTFDLEVTSDTLVPRPETELLVERSLVRMRDQDNPRVLDLGTGSGAVAMAMASERGDAVVTATDVNPQAIDVARRNAAREGLDRIRFETGDWYEALEEPEQFHLVVSNPPYVSESEIEQAGPELRFEPRAALVAGADGLEDIQRVVADAPNYLLPGGWLILEHGTSQGESVRQLLTVAGFNVIMTSRDLAGHERVTEGRFPGTGS